MRWNENTTGLLRCVLCDGQRQKITSSSTLNQIKSGSFSRRTVMRDPYLRLFHFVFTIMRYDLSFLFLSSKNSTVIMLYKSAVHDYVRTGEIVFNTAQLF